MAIVKTTCNCDICSDLIVKTSFGHRVCTECRNEKNRNRANVRHALLKLDKDKKMLDNKNIIIEISKDVDEK